MKNNKELTNTQLIENILIFGKAMRMLAEYDKSILDGESDEYIKGFIEGVTGFIHTVEKLQEEQGIFTNEKKYNHFMKINTMKIMNLMEPDEINDAIKGDCMVVKVGKDMSMDDIMDQVRDGLEKLMGKDDGDSEDVH